MPPRPKHAKLEAIPETCGSCRFTEDVPGEESLLCMGMPPTPLMEPDCTVTWHRGGTVDPTDMACAFYGHKGRA